MKHLIIFGLSAISLTSFATPAPFPVFLKSGFSSVLEFEEAPVRVVLGDSQSFQVEKLDRSLVLKANVPYATGNMFVYFKTKEPKLFILSASEDAEPTYYKKFEAPVVLQPPKAVVTRKGPAFKREMKLVSARFDPKKDYLTVEVEVSADSQGLLKPNWNLATLKSGGGAIPPYKLWAERQDVQKDSRIKARFIFAKPNVAKNLIGSSLILPLQGVPMPFVVALGGGKQ